ncbi:Oxidoreductase [Xylographa trunciseda]|nr:Oxidoreductase [Xylographa trunciseda]
MYRPASRSLLRQSLPTLRSAARRRFLTTAPPHQKSRSWKNSAARWGLGIAGVYYYNTSTVFAEEPARKCNYNNKSATADGIVYPPHLAGEESDNPLPTLASLAPSSRSKVTSSSIHPLTGAQPSILAPTDSSALPTDAPPPSTSTPADLEEEAAQQGAFNEETGEINWDCPCLGGMAHGPCGEEFRAAFSCFVYSNEEPKGMDCIDRFKGMQDCFRQHPDVYGGELDDEEDEEAEGGIEGFNDGAGDGGDEGVVGTLKGRPREETGRVIDEKGEIKTQQQGLGDGVGHDDEAEKQARTERAIAAKEQVERDHGVQSETDKMVPKATHDATATGPGISKADGN